MAVPAKRMTSKELELLADQLLLTSGYALDGSPCTSRKDKRRAEINYELKHHEPIKKNAKITVLKRIKAL